MKRLLTMLMVLCMLATMVPFGAFAAEETVEVNYDVQLKVGSNALTMYSDFDVTAFEFEPTETGVYTFTADKANAVVEKWGTTFYPFKQTENGTNKLEVEVKDIGAGFLIGISGVSSCNLTIARTGNVKAEATLEPENYVNKHTPSASYSPLTGSEKMEYVDITKSHTAVKGTDGYYHLDSATGPILYMDFTGPADEIDMTAVGGAFFLRGTVYENGIAVKKYDFLDSIKAYGACVDSKKLYPLTDDLVLFLQTYGQDQGWYNTALSPYSIIQSGNFDENTAWMINCCYDKNYVHDGSAGGNQGSGETADPTDPTDPTDPDEGTGGEVEEDTTPGSQNNPILLTGSNDVISIPAGKTMYYMGRFGGMIMTINGSKVTVEHNGQTYTASNGKVTLECVQTSMWEPCIFVITNTSSSAISYSVTVEYPLGAMDNPAALVMGSNSASCAEGGNGYFYTWTAPKDGTLEITMTSANWMYCINNMTKGLYGELQYSDSQPVVNPGSVSVSAGDEIQIQVNTYNPDNVYVAPAGKVIFTAKFTEAAEKFDIGYANMTLGNSLAMNFAFAKEPIGNAAGCYAQITQVYADGRADKVVQVPASQWTSTNIGGEPHYIAKFNGVAAKEMADTLYVTIYDAQGNALTNVWEDSVRAYAMRLLSNSSTNQETKVMAVDMLNYGAAAQTYFKYNTGDLANSQLSAAQKALATKTAVAANKQVTGNRFIGSNLGLESQILMRMAFQGVTSNMYGVISFTSHTGKLNSIRVEASEMNISNGTAVIVIDETVIADARQLVTVTIYNANGTVYDRATDSMESYIARMRLKAEDPLFEAILKFSDSAYAFFH